MLKRNRDVKKVAVLFLFTVLMLTFCGCGNSANNAYAGEWKGQVGARTETIVFEKDGSGYVQDGETMYEFEWKISSENQINVTNPDNGEILEVSVKEIDEKTVLVANNVIYYRPEEFEDNNIENSNDSSNDISETDNSSDEVTLQPDNEYMIISNIDISECTQSDGYFSGFITFTSKTTQKYVDEYDDYFYRQIYFGFYNEDGELVGDEVVQNNYLYSREYTEEDSDYVLVSSKKTISEVKVLKIVIEKPNN